MKKTFTILTLALAALTANAQNTDTTPNRMIVRSQTGNKAYAIDKVDSISFARQDGEVKAAINFKSFTTGTTGDTITVTVTRTAACESFRFAVLPTNTAKQYDDNTLARYFDQQNSGFYYEDFSNGVITGFDTPFKANTSYTVVTMGYDSYGVACESSRAEFTTPKVPTVGTPAVTWTVDETTPTSFTLTVTPNGDTSEFFWCQFDKGGAQQQFEQWGPMFGFANMEEMIKQFSGYSYTETTTHTWDGLSPNRDYEVYVLPFDVNGNYGEMQVIPVSTSKSGGDGLAEMTITIGDMEGDAEHGYNNRVIYTPNDQVSVHHDLLIEKEAYDTNYTDEQMASMMSSDKNPFNPFDSYWDQVGVDDVQWIVDPATSYYALSIAQNAKGEWGPFVKKEFTTPAASANPAAGVSVATPARVVKNAAKIKRFGVVPATKQGLKLQMAK